MKAALHMRTALILMLTAVAVGGGTGCAGTGEGGDVVFNREEPLVPREFRPVIGDRWIGNGIAYGPHRDGQRPGGPDPGREEIREDLRLMAGHWSLIRVYGSAGPTETLLALIREEKLALKVMLGAWIDVEERRDDDGTVLERFPEARAANRREMETAVRLVAEYPEIVLAVNVGNETQVFWSAHRSPADILIEYLREMRARVPVPVTTVDDYNFWNKPESRAVADEVDFIVAHAHPLWNGIQLENALPWTETTLAEIRAKHPDHLVVLGETGWATAKHDQGEQARLIKGQTGEAEQAEFFRALNRWVEEKRIPTFFFEAFDENWKGGEHADEVEKHWGLYRADRTPKTALAGGH